MQEMVETVVSFSRCLYAQMVTQGYDAPRRYPLPLPSEEAFAAAQLGMKLVAGFEMLLAQASMDLAPGGLIYPSPPVHSSRPWPEWGETAVLGMLLAYSTSTSSEEETLIKAWRIVHEIG
jgi:hypothetical protein